MCGPASFHHHSGSCGCHEHTLRLGGFVTPCLLLLLKDSPAHGYELIEKLSNQPFINAVPDPAVIYRHLRRLEEEGMVKSRIEQGSGGPARKIYSLTPEGESYLRGWASVIRSTKKSLESFLEAYEKHFSTSENEKD